MKLGTSLLLLLLTTPTVQAADWIKISSTNFDLLTNGSEEEARKTLATFEEARDFFLREQTSLAGPAGRVTVVGFNSYRDYQPYSSKPGALAYSLPRGESDYIVLSDLQAQRMRVAIHEYVHVLVRHSGFSVPLWLNEGMAEVYSTLEAKDGKLLLGTMKPDRLQALGGGNWMRLPILLRVDHQSREYNETDLESMFYAQSCLLAHMLMLGDGYRDKFPEFLERVSATGSPAPAFLEVYGKNTADMEGEMRSYFRERVLGGEAYRAAIPKLAIGAATAASGAEVGATLVDLMARTGRGEQAESRLKALAAEYPENAYIEQEFGFLEAVHGQNGAAIAHLRSALAMHPEGWSAYWEFARLLDDNGGELGPRVEALQEVLRRKSDLTAARLRLARDLSMDDRDGEAMELLRAMTDVEPEYAVQRLYQMAVVSLDLNRNAAALEYAEEAGQAAHNPREKTTVQQLIERIRRRLGTPGPSPRKDADPDRPVLRHTSPPPVTKKQ